MINNVHKGIGGVNIKPSARRSIHDHSGACPMRIYETMGRYGIHSHHDQERVQAPPQHDAPGTDEIDNVMSKMAQPCAPIAIPKDRRNSVDAMNQHSDDYSDENVLSKPSPPNFPLHCSYENGSAIILESTIIREDIQDRLTNFRLSQIADGELDAPPESITKSTLLYAVIIGIAAIACYVWFLKMNACSETIFYNNINNLGLKYKLNDDTILRIKSGMTTICKKEGAASSFMFVYNSKADTFQPAVFDNFIKELAAATVKFLRSDGNSDVVVVDSRKQQTDLELMDLQHEVDRTGVMLVPNVHEVPSEQAMAFHYYCDEYDPLVKRSVIFFTLDSAMCLNDIRLTHECIEKCLSKKWKNIHEDKIGPLLTRVINIIIDATTI